MKRSHYLPYTTDMTNTEVFDGYVDRKLLKLLEGIRYEMQSLRDEGLFAAEIHQSLLAVEQALLYTDHYYKRRAKSGIFTLPIPENFSETLETIQRQPRGKLQIRFVKDSYEGDEEVGRFVLEDVFASQEIPIVFGLLEYYLEKPPVYYIYDKSEDELVLKFIVNDIEESKELSYNDLLVVRERIKENAPTDNLSLKELRFISLLDGKRFVYKIKEDALPEFAVHTSAGQKRLFTLIGQLSEYFRDELQFNVFGNNNQVGNFFFFNRLTEEDTNALTQKLDKLTEELLQRRFI